MEIEKTLLRLHSSHRADLQASGLNDEMIEMMGARSLPPREINALMPGGLPEVESVLVFPYFSVNGFCRYKLFPSLVRDGKSIRYIQPSGSGCHLYILPAVSERLADTSAPLFIVEGEKKTAAAVQLGLNAIGIGGVWNWKVKDCWRGIEELQAIALADRDVELVFDSDTWTRDELQQPVYALGRYLELRGAKVSVCIIPQPGREKVGLDDYLLDHNLDDFGALKKITLKHQALAQHKDWYESWKAEKEGNKEDSNLQGQALILREIQPWDTTVDGAAMLADICRAIRQYVVAGHADIVAAALWAVHAHAIDAFPISPFLNPTSPEKGCGKTTLLSVLYYMLPRPVLSGSMSPSSIFRSIEKFRPSFLIDEADTFEKISEELRGLLNASHARISAHSIRTVGEDHEPRFFSTWCPKAVSLIGPLPDTLQDRSIIVQMRRRKKTEPCEPFSSIEPHPELEVLGRKIARWVQDNFDALRQSKPEAPEGLELRVYDNWRPLLAVADVAGGEWPRWARIAAGSFVAKADDQQSIKVELLNDIHEIVQGQDRISSEDLVKALGEMADRPWASWRHGKPINQSQLAKLLKGFEIKSTNVRIGDKVPKGFYAGDFQDALSRYVPLQPPKEPLRPLREKKNNEVGELETIFVADEAATSGGIRVSQSATGPGTESRCEIEGNWEEL